jgi:hypothetical protein
MAEKITIDIDAKIEAAQSIADLKELKKLLKDTAAGSDSFKKLANGIDDLEDKIKGAKNTSADWIDSLESAGGPLGALGAGINKAKVATQTFGGALKATGIGLIVSLIGGLVAAFSKTEGSLKKLEPVTIAFEKTLGGVVAAVEPLLEGLAELALKVMPYVTDAFKVAYSAVTAVFQSLGKLGQAVGKLIKGDFAGAWDTAKESVTSFKDNFVAAEARFEEGYKKTTATQKKNFEEQEKLRQEALQKRLKELESQDKLDEALLAKQKAIALSLAVTEQEKLDVEKTFIQKSYQLKEQDLKDKQSLYKVGTAEYKDYQAQLVQLDTERTTALTAVKEKQTEITKAEVKKQFDAEISALDLKKAQGLIKEEEYQKGIYDLAVKYNQEKEAALVKYEAFQTEARKKSAADARELLGIELQAKFDALDAENQRIEMDFEQDLIRFGEQKTLLAEQEANELANTELTEKERTEIRQKYADKRKSIVTAEVETEKAAAAAKQAINMAYLGLFEQFGNLLGQIAGKNKGLAIAGIVISQAAAIGQIIANTAIANAKSIAASPLTLGQPWVAINTISAGLSIASTIASAAKSIQQINSQPGAPASNAGASAGGGAVPQIAFGGTSAPVPITQTISGANPTAQIAQTLANASGKPVRAYVVSSDISSQQAMDRRTNVASTFSAG